MNIGILSMQQIKNYGSFLQAFALKKTIEELGHKCEFIPLEKGIELKEISSKHTKFEILQRFIGFDFYKRIWYTFKFHKRFKNEFLPYLNVSRGVGQKFDIVVIGSDEVFNCLQKSWWGFSLQLFGKGLNASKVITYAASFGGTTLDALSKFNIDKEVAAAIQNLSAVSVRDQNSFSIIKSLSTRVADINVDPVLIYNYDGYLPSDIAYKNFILIYSYPNRLNDNEVVRKIKDFAVTKGLKIISIGHYFPWCDKTVTPSPFEVLALFKKANYIITDTFHGSIMSIKYNRPFCTIVREMNNNKLSSLLKQFGLESKLWNDDILLDKLFELSTYNYEYVNEIIALESDKSRSYLSKELS